jgi:hypothetical protein
MNARLAGLFALCAVSSIVACSPGASDEAASSDQAQTQTTPGTSLVVPPPGSTNNPISAADQALIVSAWKNAKKKFYDDQSGYFGFNNQSTGQLSWSRPAANQAPQYSEVATVPCPAYYGELVCHFYQHMPSYQHVIPNVRGCFSQLANGRLKIPARGNNPAHDGVYPEMWDYCMYQDYDAVAGRNPGAYDLDLINTNKAAGNEIGVLRFLDDDIRPVFQFIMYTWYEPNTYVLADQQAILSQVYSAFGLPVPAARRGLSTHPQAATIIPAMKAYFEEAANHPPKKAASPPQPPPPPPPPPPPLGALPGTSYGNTSGTTNAWSPNYLAGFPVTITTAGQLQQFGIVTGPNNGAIQTIMALYTDAGGNPGTLVTSTAATPLWGNDERIAPLATPLLAPGKYWVMAEFNGTVQIGTVGGQGKTMHYVSHPFGSALPANPGMSAYSTQHALYVVVN